jgi:hypothetical protein
MIDSLAVLASLILLCIAVRQLVRLEGTSQKAGGGKWRAGPGK